MLHWLLCASPVVIINPGWIWRRGGCLLTEVRVHLEISPRNFNLTRLTTTAQFYKQYAIPEPIRDRPDNTHTSTCPQPPQQPMQTCKNNTLGTAVWQICLSCSCHCPASCSPCKQQQQQQPSPWWRKQKRQEKASHTSYLEMLMVSPKTRPKISSPADFCDSEVFRDRLNFLVDFETFLFFLVDFGKCRQP